MLSLLCKKLGKFLYEKGMRKVIRFTYSGTVTCSFAVSFLRIYAGIILYYICSHAVLDTVLREDKRHASLVELNRQDNHRGDIQRDAFCLPI